MTKEMIIEMLEKLGDDVMFDIDYKGNLEITINDFEGFDDDWCEIVREYDVDAVDAVLKEIEKSAVSVDGDFYRYYSFEGFEVCVGYCSFDI